jgi:hypothetical protein
VAVVDISIVTYAPDLAALGELVGSLRKQMQGVQAQLLIQDNSPDLETTAQIERHLSRGEVVVKIDVRRSGSNLGFGRGHKSARLIDERPALDGQRSRGIDRVDEPRFGEKARCTCELLREIPAYPADERL